ncbi:MAG: TetR/AcrR family transcriptional regulator [Candidatus Binatia bacterium]
MLECAERIFARKGFHEATMQAIAREAEYAAGTLYTLFDSKDDLFAAVVRRRLPEIDAHLRQAAAAGTAARDKIDRFVRAFFEFFDARKDLFHIYVHVTGGFLWNVKAELGDEVAQRHLALLAFVERIVRDGIRRGDIDDGLEPRVTAVALVGTLVAVATDWIAQAPDRPFESRRDATLRLITALLDPPARRRPAASCEGAAASIGRNRWRSDTTSSKASSATTRRS